LFDLFKNDNQMITSLEIPSGASDLIYDMKIRKQVADTTIITTDQYIDEEQTALVLPFMDMSFIPYNGTMENHRVSHGLLEINIYGTNLIQLNDIYSRINELFDGNYEDLQITYSGQASCTIKNAICYRIRVKPLCKT
jgi:hypothetical protein